MPCSIDYSYYFSCSNYLIQKNSKCITQLNLFFWIRDDEKKSIWERFPTLFDCSLIDECFSFVLIILYMYTFIAYSKAMGFLLGGDFSFF
jgi:hypothetical protein